MSSTPKQFSYGGQAVIEGVMMRGAHKFAVAVRNPQGEIIIHEQPLSKTLYRSWISRTPFVRGVVGLWDALGLGTRALLWSADVAMMEEPAKPADVPPGMPMVMAAAGPSTSVFTGPLGIGTLAVSLLFGVGIFFIFPTAASTAIGAALGLQDNPTLVNLIETVIQLVILIAYMGTIGLMPDVKRLFGYHGAEHKTINAYEAGAELTPEVVQGFPIEHPRCGTAFLLTVAFVGFFVFSLLGRPDFVLLVLSRIVLIPVIAGIAYELLRFTANHIDNPIIRLMVIPNLALQHLTTRQPDLSMIEVAIAAFKRVLISESLAPEEPMPVAEPAAAGD